MTWKLSTAILALALALPLVCLPAPVRGQTPENWVSGWGGLFMDPGTVPDDESGTRWDLGTSFAAGASFHRLFGRSLIAGFDLGYSPIRYELRDRDSGASLEGGRGHLLATMATGRLGAGGGGDFFTYLAGGIGALTYGIPALDRWDPDLALRAGGGVEYRHSRTVALFLEWNRWWVLHQSQGVDDNTVRHANLQLGARYGF